MIFGNPKVGTPIMQANRKAAMDLPLKILIWSEGGKTMMGAPAPEGLKDRYGIDGAEEQLKMMSGAPGKLMDAAAKWLASGGRPAGCVIEDTACLFTPRSAILHHDNALKRTHEHDSALFA